MVTLLSMIAIVKEQEMRYCTKVFRALAYDCCDTAMENEDDGMYAGGCKSKYDLQQCAQCVTSSFAI